MTYVTFTHVYPPIPIRSADWCAHWDDAEGPVGWGATKRDALNNLLDNTDVEFIAKHFGIEAREVDTLRGPEYGHWVAFTDNGDSLEAGWRDQAIVDLAAKLVEPEL